MARSKDDVTAIILAAGHGKRMRPITNWLPKPLVPVGGTPILVRNLRHLGQQGFRRATVVYGRPTMCIPDFLESVDLGELEVGYAFQKDQRGTGDALLTGMNASEASAHCLLMVGDTIYSQEHLDAVWDAFAGEDVDGALLLKELAAHKLRSSSMVVLDGNGQIATMIPKPSPAEIKEHDGTLADASLHIYDWELGRYLSKVPLSRTNELEVTSALVQWIADGARITGVVAPTPLHVTNLEDFITHNVPSGLRLVAATELENAVTECSDKDISGYISSLTAADIPFIYRRLSRLSKEPMAPPRRARALAILSEICRHQALQHDTGGDAQLDQLSRDLRPEKLIEKLEPEILGEQTRSLVYHHLAVAYAKYANESVGASVFREANAMVTPSDQDVAGGRSRVVVRTPARLAFSSSQGSDISYIIEEKSAVILNCAIKVDGELPGLVIVERIDEPHIELVAPDTNATGIVTDCSEIFGHLRADDPLVLLKAGLRFSGIVSEREAGPLQDAIERFGSGLRITVSNRLPKGSGLGCSAILAAAIVRGVRELACLDTTRTDLLVRSYCCERTYGRSGYQDIIGGITGGVKLIQADASTGLFNPTIEQISLSQEQLNAISENLVVFHTGSAHLNNSYLLTIPAKYFTRSTDYMYAYENGKQLTHAMVEALREGDWERLGTLIGEYWNDREYFEDGVTPDFAARYRVDLAQWCHGTALCGSGRGGYMMAIPRDGKREVVLDYLRRQDIASEAILNLSVVQDGLVVEVE